MFTFFNSRFFFNSLPNYEYSKLLIITTFFNRPFSDKREKVIIKVIKFGKDKAWLQIKFYSL